MQNPFIPYSRDEVFRPGPARVYRDRQLDNIAFPLGGIGTGSISIGGWGQLRDFEIFNRPNKGLMFDSTFFTLYSRTQEGKSTCRVVQGPVGGSDFTGSGVGVNRMDGSGLPRFSKVEFEGAFPFARIRLQDPKVPLKVELEAYNPFIPLNPDDSGLPVAIFNFHISNPGSQPVEAVLFARLENKIGYPETGGGIIECFEDPGVRGLNMSTGKHSPDSPRFGSLALATPYPDVRFQTHGYRGVWFDELHRFWDAACSGNLEEIGERAEREEGTDIGSLALRAMIKPGQSVRLPVWIAWHQPVFEKYWDPKSEKPTWKNYYASQFDNAAAVTRYLAEHERRLEKGTRAFADAIFSSTLPEPVQDAISSQLSILKSTTCLRLEDGTFYGFEGCHPESGCCEGTCTHVWNYAQALAWLFPSLERSVREADYRCNLHEDGHMTFRLPLPLGSIPEADFHAAADGQLGGVMKLYRDWQISGYDEWLRQWWPKAQKALEYAWKNWDPKKKGVIRGVQHNTYDIEFHGPNTMIGGFYLGALRAAEAISRHLGQNDKAEEYRAIFESGRKQMEEELYKGDYYIHKVEPVVPKTDKQTACTCSCSKDAFDEEGWPKYQYGEGCLSDQMIGQWYARMLKLGDLFDHDRVRQTLGSIFKYNWRNDLSEHANPQRIYALGDEAGLLLATWPKGGRPRFPFPYSDEVWCGIEYQVASHLIYEGLLEEGLTIVKAVRDRHDGVRRNPWNEFECGNHYARSLASYSLLLALADFHYSTPTQTIQFRPAVQPEKFRCFFSTGSGWGIYNQTFKSEESVALIELLYGTLTLKKISLALPGASFSATFEDQRLAILSQSVTGGIELKEPVTLQKGQTLSIHGEL